MDRKVGGGLPPAGSNHEANRLDIRRIRLPHRVGAHDNGARLVVLSGGNGTFTVPSARSVGAGHSFWVANATGSNLALAFLASDLAGGASYTINSGTLGGIQFFSDGVGWYLGGADAPTLIAGTGISITGSAGTGRTITATGGGASAGAANATLPVECYVDSDGNLLAGVGVTSVTHDDDGEYTVNYSVTYTQVDYPAVATPDKTGTQNAAMVYSRTTTSIKVRCYSNHNTGPERENAAFSLVVGGAWLLA